MPQPLTSHQLRVLNTMPRGEWIRPNGSVTFAALERAGYLETMTIREPRRYGRSPEMLVTVRLYRKP